MVVISVSLLMLVPFVDRSEERNPRNRRFFVIAFFVALSVVLALTVIAIMSPPGRHLGG